MPGTNGKFRRGPVRRRDPNPNSQWIKLFYKIIQAIHHYNIMKNQANGLGATKGFKQQVQLLDKFLKPAQPTPGLTQELERLNRMWATKVAETLTLHYKTRISELMGMIVGFGFADFTIKDLSNQALDWAKQNFRKKLNLGTIQEYQRIVKSFTPVTSKPQNNSTSTSKAPTPPVANNNKGYSKAWDINQWIPKSPRRKIAQKLISPQKLAFNQIELTNRFQPLRILDTNPQRTTTTTTPKKQQLQQLGSKATKRSLEGTFATSKPSSAKSATSPTSHSVRPQNKKKKTTIPSVAALCAEITSRTPTPNRNISTNRRSPSPRSSLSRSSSLSMSPSYPKQSYAAVVASPPKQQGTNIHRGNKPEWKLPKSTQPTLIIGDSNLARITNPTSKTLQIESYSGAKISHIQQLIKDYQHQEQPKEIIINIGINDRAYNNTNRVAQSLKALAKTAKETFPDSDIYLTKLPISNTLDLMKPKEASNIRQLNENLNKLALEGVRILESDAIGGWFFHVDGIHWSPRTANSIADNWVRQVKL